MDSFFDKLKEALGRLSGSQRVQLGLALVATLCTVWGLVWYANRVRYGVLFNNLDRNDASAVVATLKEMRVPYRLSAGGRLVEVPAAAIDELRLDLASEGLPPGGGVGFEIFDKPAFGLSDFIQNVNYQRALERELARSIQSLDAVESARVHLALPAESAFAQERSQPSASVVIRLRAGRSIAEDRMGAITHLVAAGVEGLEPTNVRVIDAAGNMLAGGESDELRLTARQHEAKREFERNIERTLISILEPVAGVGRVRARATVELNMTRVEKRQESFDPNVAVVRSEQKKKSKGRGPGPAGVPGTDSNLPGGGGATASGGATQDSTESLTNFEINKVVSTVSEPAGNLVRQSVAVLIDEAPGAAAATGTAGGEPEPEPRTEQELEQITELVKAAIGYDPQRGDVLNVESIPFERGVPHPEPGPDMLGFAVKIAKYGSLPLAVLVLVLLVIRPGIAALRSAAAPQAGADSSLPPTVAQLQARLAGTALGDGSAAGGSPLRAKLLEAVRDDPQTAAMVVRSWITDEGES